MNTLKAIIGQLTKLALSRIGKVVVLAALLAVAAYFTREVWQPFLQWSSVLFGVWVVLAILSVLFMNPLRPGTWRKIAGALVAAFALSGVLALFPFPPGDSRTSSGGELAYYIAFAPLEFELRTSENYAAALLLAEVRILVLAVAALWISFSPNLIPNFLTNFVRPMKVLAFWNLFQREPKHPIQEDPTPVGSVKKNRKRSRSAPGGKGWTLPALPEFKGALFSGASKSETDDTSRLIEETLAHHGIDAKIDSVFKGPAVTLYGITPGWKTTTSGRRSRVKVGDVTARENDLALALKSPNIRFEPVLEGESQIGLEVPNKKRASVKLAGLFHSEEWRKFESSAALPVPLGVKSGGAPVFCDIADMPHTMVAGTTGSGKSVCINGIITSLLAFRNPEQLRMVLVDPKRVEMGSYREVPHLLTPVIVDPEPAVAALNALTEEMETRLKTLEEAGVRNIVSYNQKAAEHMPYILVVIDEMADLMIRAAEKVERLLVRLAQLGRAPGIHLLIATQRPSVDVITGIIKANFPSRVSFAVRSNADSRTVLDAAGAEKLLGNGDMLYFPSDFRNPERVQGAFVEDKEIADITNFWKKVGKKITLPQLDISTAEEPAARGTNSSANAAAESQDPLLNEAVQIALRHKTISISYLQRQLGVGFPRAGKIMDQLERRGTVGPAVQNMPRKVLEKQ